jgi:hypothetical protein
MKTKFSKSEKIREYMKANPTKGPKEVADALKSKGIKVTPGLVSVVKSKIVNKPSAKAAVKAPKAESQNGHVRQDIVEAIMHAKGLVGFAGSLDKAKNFLDLVSRI